MEDKVITDSSFLKSTTCTKNKKDIREEDISNLTVSEKFVKIENKYIHIKNKLNKLWNKVS